MVKPIVMRVPGISWEVAEIWERKLMLALKGRTDAPNYTGIEAEHRFGWGYMGEQVFRDLLWWRGKKWFYAAHPDGRSHGADFTIWLKEGGERSVDVKCASKVFHKTMRVTKAQFRLRHCQLYVAVRMHSREWGIGTQASVHGWLTRQELEAWPVTKDKGEGKMIEGRLVPWDKLHDMEELLEGLVEDEPHFLLEKKIVPAIPVESQGIFRL